MTFRRDIPGTPGWRSTPEEFSEQKFADPAFDLRTYLVAVDRGSGEYLALVRIWMNRGWSPSRRDRRPPRPPPLGR